MRQDFKERWRAKPDFVRKPVVFILGWFFIIAAGLTGWLPGPGGIPLFLLGIALLATEFKWAERIQKPVLDIIYAIGRWYRRHRFTGNVALILLAIIAVSFFYVSLKLLFK